MSDAEEAAIRGLVLEERTVEPRTTVIREGEQLSSSTLLLDGLMSRYKDLENGQRQITELHVPGDFADMHSYTLKVLDHSIQALTRSVIAVVPHERIARLIQDHPRLGRIYWFGTNLDAAIHREWVLSLGRRDAPQRTAALFCELQARLGLVGMADDDGFDIRLTQIELGECLGLTSVHVNRVLRQLREMDLVLFKSRRVQILDLPRLRSFADFSADYLYLDAAEL